MSLTPLFESGVAIYSHALLALASVLIGGIQLAAPKGTGLHRWLGYLWVALMAYVAVSSFFINEIKVIGDWSPIHLLSGLTLVTLVIALHAARSGKIQRHLRAMRALYFLALIVAGAFTLLPGRTMHTVVFGT